jgi:hypothetical protein
MATAGAAGLAIGGWRKQRRARIPAPPTGILVYLGYINPRRAATVTVNAKYLEFGGIWYRPFYSGSDVVYQTVPNPTG